MKNFPGRLLTFVLASVVMTASFKQHFLKEWVPYNLFWLGLKVPSPCAQGESPCEEIPHLTIHSGGTTATGQVVFPFIGKAASLF